MSLVKKYYKMCATCKNYALLNPSQLTNKGFKCHEKYQHYDLDDSCPSRMLGGYQENRNVTNKHIEDAIEMLEERRKACFITTMVVDVLEYNDDNYYLNTLRNFRNNVLQQDSKYSEALYIYDKIGPIIAKEIENDEAKEGISLNMFQSFIVKICFLIEEEAYDFAINIYQQMVFYLMDRYNIMIFDYVNEYENQDLKETGHGYVRVRKNSYNN